MAGKLLAEKLDRLRRAGFTIDYVDARKAYEQGYVRHDFREVAQCYGTDGCVPFVNFDVRDECAYGQSSTLDRSNYRSLVRDFPGAFVPISYTNVNSLGGIVHSMSDDLIDTMIGLLEQYPIYDESDMSDLEWEEISEAFDQYLWADTLRDLPEEWQDVADMFTEAEIRDAFYAAMYEADYYPEHGGLDIDWDDRQVAGIAVDALTALVREHCGPGWRLRKWLRAS